MKSARIIVSIFFILLSVLNVNAQFSEQEIRNRYQRRIEQEQQKLENLRQSLQEAYEELKQYDPNYYGGGLLDDNYGKQLNWIEILKRDIEYQSSLVESLPRQRDEEIRRNRELEENIRRQIELQNQQRQKQQQIDQQKANQARIQQKNQQRQQIENAKREQRREQARINAQKQAEREEKLRAERKERERKERERQQQLYQQAYSQSMARSAKSFERKMAYADAQRENMSELIEAQIDHIPTHSGYVPSSQGTTMRPNVRSKAGILPKRGSVKSDPLSDWPYKSRIPITQYPDPAYQPKFELIEIPRTSIFPKKSYDQVVWDSLRNNCSENQYLLLLHTVREMNGGKRMPKVLGFNKAGNIVMIGDDNNIFSVTPDGNRIFFTKLEEHDYRTENILKKIESGEPLVKYSAEGQAFGKNVKITKDDKPWEEELEDNEHRFEGMRITTSKNNTMKLSNFFPSAEAKAVIDIIDNSSTMTMNYVRLGENHAWDFEFQVVGGQKVKAEAKADFNLLPDMFHSKFTDFSGVEVMSKETYKYEGTPEITVRERGIDDMGRDVTKKPKVGFSAGIGADLLKGEAKVKYSYIEDIKGRKFVVTKSFGGNAGTNAGAKFKASTKKLQIGSFLFAGLSWDVTRVEVIDDKKWRE